MTTAPLKNNPIAQHKALTEAERLRLAGFPVAAESIRTAVFAARGAERRDQFRARLAH